MGKNKGGGGKGDQRARDKVDHRGGGRGTKRGEADETSAAAIPQDLIDKAVKYGCEVWEVEKYEAKNQMREVDSDEEEDSDLSEESKAAIKPRVAKANMAANNREMPPDSSSEEEDEQPRAAAKQDPEEEEKKGEDQEEAEDSDDDSELERLYGMGRNNNKEVVVVP